MPELPEVETLARALTATLVDRRVTEIEFFRDDLRRKIPKESIREILLNQKIRSVSRRSKYLIVSNAKGSLICHLGMTGRLLLRSSNSAQIKHTHAIFSLSKKDGLPNYLHFSDPRRFGLLDYLDAQTPLNHHQLLKNLGPEPLECNDLGNWLWLSSKTRTQAIKGFLMDPRILVGVGNIYASEALFHARIHPSRPANKIKKNEYDRIGLAIVQTLESAISSGGTTFRDFLNTDGNPGYFSVLLNVYGRQGLPCPNCSTPISSMTHQGRTTFLCTFCQI